MHLLVLVWDSEPLWSRCADPPRWSWSGGDSTFGINCVSPRFLPALDASLIICIIKLYKEKTLSTIKQSLRIKEFKQIPTSSILCEILFHNRLNTPDFFNVLTDVCNLHKCMHTQYHQLNIEKNISLVYSP